MVRYNTEITHALDKGFILGREAETKTETETEIEIETSERVGDTKAHQPLWALSVRTACLLAL